MPRFAANLTMMFNEHPFMERFAAAAACGFVGVEFLFPYDHPPAVIADALRQSGLAPALFNLPPGDWAAGERGIASLPGRDAEFLESVSTALAYARAAGCQTLHCMAGLLPEEAMRPACEAVYIANLRRAAALAAADGVTLLIEPINTRDMPKYLLNRQARAREIIDEVGAANLKLQLDLYHCQIMEGDLARHIDEFLGITGHIQIAGVPERHEPDLGEINYPYLFERLDARGYSGWIGCEYRPRAGTAEGLGWAAAYLHRP